VADIPEMKVTIDFSAIAETRWYEYLSRFVFGGIVTAVAGIVAKDCGPAVGGLFLAFPAIFPATATLIENHEREKKQNVGMQGTARGRKAAAVDATGASLGAFGLIAFAVLIWKLIEPLPIWATLLIATLAWFAVSFCAWKIWKNR
jgi:hypothetical protein